MGPAAKLFEAILELILPVLMGKIVDTGFSSDSRGFIIRTALLMFGMAAMGLAAATVCQYCAARASSGVGARLRDQTFDAGQFSFRCPTGKVRRFVSERGDDV